MTKGKQDALWDVQKYGFALYDTALFLDTHPDNRAALSFYEVTRRQYIEAVETYEREFGPLDQMSSDCGNSWEWVDRPWPWEKED